MKPDDKTFYDRVVEKLDALRARADADREWFQFVCRYTSNAQGNRDGERLTRDGDTATKSYKGLDVYSFTVKDGQSVISPVGRAPESYTDREQALDRMAELVAAAVNDPDWGREAVDEVLRPSKPLYPV